MALLISTAYAVTTFFFLFLHIRGGNSYGGWPYFFDPDYVEVALNLEYLETEFFCFGALGYGLDIVNPSLSMGGPPPIGGQRANLSLYIRDITYQFCLQEVGHLRAIKRHVKGFPRPLINISSGSFAAIMNSAFGGPLIPPFNPYLNDIHYLLASYVIPYVGLTGYVKAASNVVSPTIKGLVASLLGVESGQDAVIRSILYQFANLTVFPYHYTVGQFTEKISILRNNLCREFTDEGIVVDISLGAEGRITGNVLAGDEESLAYGRTPEEIFRIVYGSGNESVPGCFFPHGCLGKFALSFLSRN